MGDCKTPGSSTTRCRGRLSSRSCPGSRKRLRKSSLGMLLPGSNNPCHLHAYSNCMLAQIKKKTLKYCHRTCHCQVATPAICVLTAAICIVAQIGLVIPQSGMLWPTCLCLSVCLSLCVPTSSASLLCQCMLDASVDVPRCCSSVFCLLAALAL